MDPAKTLYPNHWQGELPDGLQEVAASQGTVDINAFYNIEYLQHRHCPRWTSTEKLKVLFHGCGTGEYLVLTALRYPHASFTACDPMEEAASMAKEYVFRLGLENIEFKDDEELSESFSMIWSCRPLHHYDEPGLFFARIKELLDPDGLFCFNVDADIENRYYLDFGQRLHDILNDNGDLPGFNQAMQTFKSELANYLETSEWPASGAMNVPGIYNFMDNQGLQILEFVNHHNYNIVNYLPDNERKVAAACEDTRLRHALAELASGRMLRHSMVLAFPHRQAIMPGPDDNDIKNLVPWRSPFIAMRNEGDRVILSLNHAHLSLDERIILEDVSVPAKMLDIVKRFDTISSLQVVHRRFLPMSWDVFHHFITALWECELVYLHRK